MSIDKPGVYVQGIDCIRQRLKILFKTRPGTDPFRPTFGIGIFDFVDKPSNSAIPDMQQAIIEAVNEFMPEIEIIKINVSLEGVKTTFTTTYRILNTVKIETFIQSYGG